VSASGFLQGFFQQVVGAVAVARDGVGDHQVGEPVDVARRFQHGLRRHGRALDFQHALLQHEVGPPRGGDVGLDGAAGRAVVVKAGDGAVNFKGGQVKEAALQRVGDGGAVGLRGRGGRAARHGLQGGLGGFRAQLQVFQAVDLRVDGGLFAKRGGGGGCVRGEVEGRRRGVSKSENSRRNR